MPGKRKGKSQDKERETDMNIDEITEEITTEHSRENDSLTHNNIESESETIIENRDRLSIGPENEESWHRLRLPHARTFTRENDISGDNNENRGDFFEMRNDEKSRKTDAQRGQRFPYEAEGPEPRMTRCNSPVFIQRSETEREERHWSQNFRHDPTPSYRMYQDQHNSERQYRPRNNRMRDERITLSGANINMPAFTGKDDWKVWINRFEAIAERRAWSDDEKLDEILPRIQGEAGEFVFTQLPKEALQNYVELVRELGYRYRIIENQKSYISMFCNRNQKVGERVEEYAAELKRLHHKAYPKRTKHQRREDLLERFMRGVLDEEVRFFVNYMKTPNDIDEAVYAVVECMSERQTCKYREPYSDKKMRKYVRRASSFDEEYEGDTEFENEEERGESVLRLKNTQKHNQKQQNKSTECTEVENKDKNQNVSSNQCETESETKKLIEQLQQRISMLENMAAQPNVKTPENKTLVCFNCNKPGHVSKNCRAPRRQKPTQYKRFPSYQNTRNSYNTQNCSSSDLNYRGQPQMATREPSY